MVTVMERRVPYIPQVGADDCGAASLAMVMAYYGRHVPLAEVRQAFGVASEATSALAVIKVARANGFNAEGFWADLDHLGDFPVPAILHWKSGHFVVLERVTPSGVALVDPACGPRFVSNELLQTAFTGVALTFEPSSTFEPRGRWRRIRSFCSSIIRRMKRTGET